MATINWFPGHMKKTKREIQDNLKLVDAVIEIRDARIPRSSANPDIDKLCAGKPRLILLNKSDLTEAKVTKDWINTLSSETVKVLEVNCLKGQGLQQIKPALLELLKEKHDRAKAKGLVKFMMRVMVVGVPNCGKSTFINKMARNNIAKTGDRAGVTKSKQWIKTSFDMEMLDTPGVLWPKFEDQDVALNLAFCRAIKDEILDVETLALRLIGKLMEIEPEKLKARYKLEELGDRDIETMDMIGRKRGFIMGNKELDYTRIATTVLNEFRDGKIGKITLEVPEDIKK